MQNTETDRHYLARIPTLIGISKNANVLLTIPQFVIQYTSS